MSIILQFFAMATDFFSFMITESFYDIGVKLKINVKREVHVGTFKFKIDLFKFIIQDQNKF